VLNIQRDARYTVNTEQFSLIVKHHIVVGLIHVVLVEMIYFNSSFRSIDDIIRSEISSMYASCNIISSSIISMRRNSNSSTKG
jgi:hypothetical protein